ncbi:MAG: cell division protein CrgA [Acidimicrobiales bacterium]
MAKAQSRRPGKTSNGRVTAKAPKATGRYTPPVPRATKVSPPWVPVLMFCLLGIGAVMIVLNYLVVLPGSPSNWYLLGGLGLVSAGFLTATTYR